MWESGLAELSPKAITREVGDYTWLGILKSAVSLPETQIKRQLSAKPTPILTFPRKGGRDKLQVLMNDQD